MHTRARGAAGLFATGALFGLIGSCIVQPAQQNQPQYGQQQQGYNDGYGDQDKQQPEGNYAMPNGDYTCTISDYPPFQCRVWIDDGGVQWVEKLQGSQRFRGKVMPTENGFSFDGTYYCPYGSCTENVRGEFTAYDDGLYKGNLRGSHITPVAFQFQPGGLGGSVYGGQGYGGFGYGGFGYGGRAYGR